MGLYLVPAACFWKPIPCEGSLLGPIALPNLYAWSPDGSRLALEEGIDTLEVFAVRSRTSIKYEKTFRSIYDIRWSPSGRWIAISVGPSDDLLVFDPALNYFTSLSAEKVSFYPYSWIWVR